MYQALYRKYRPQCFGDVAGQEHITETLRRQIALNRLSHAYLFVGTRGTGKTTCAKILARAVNCESPEGGEPCNKCPACVGIENGSILDVLELDAASNNGVDNVRALREEAIYSPASVRKRVYIVDEVHMLSTPAFNALLKILEEPPEHLMFILATTELHKVPSTILSRCQRFSFKRLSPAAIAARLQSVAAGEGLTLAADAAAKLASLGDGSMRDALSLLDQCASDTFVDLRRVLDTIGLAGQQELIDLAEAAANRDTAAALSLIGKLYDDGKDMPALLSELAALLRDVLVYGLSKDSPLLSGAFSGGELSGLSVKMTPERLFAFLDVIREAMVGLSRGESVKLSVEMCLIRMCDERLSDDFSAIVSRIARLEKTNSADHGNAGCERRNAEIADGATDNEQWAMNNKQRTADNGQFAHDDPVTDPVADPETSDSQSSALDSQLSTTTLCAPHSSNLPQEGGYWEDILKLMLADEPQFHGVLSNSEQVSAELSGSTLTIRARNQFFVDQIESKKLSEALKKAAADVLGREIVIRTEMSAGSDSPESRSEDIDRLIESGHIKKD